MHTPRHQLRAEKMHPMKTIRMERTRTLHTYSQQETRTRNAHQHHSVVPQSCWAGKAQRRRHTPETRLPARKCGPTSGLRPLTAPSGAATGSSSSFWCHPPPKHCKLPAAATGAMFVCLLYCFTIHANTSAYATAEHDSYNSSETYSTHTRERPSHRIRLYQANLDQSLRLNPLNSNTNEHLQ